MEEAAVKNMKLSRSKRKATSSQSQFIDDENRPISAAASGSSSSQPNTFGKESQDDCHMSEDEAAANKEFSFCIDKDVNRSSNEFYSADDASTPGKIDEKRSPIFKANGKRSPIFGDSGKRSPIFELNGNRSPIFEDNGKRSPIFEFRGKRSPIFEDNGKQSPIFEDNGNRSPIFEYSGNRSPMFEDIGNRSPIFEDSTYSPGSGVVCNGDDGGQGSANSSKGSEGSKNGTKRSSVVAESSTLKKIRLNNSEESLKTEGNPGDITVTKHSAEDVDLFDESLNLPNTTEYFSELEKSVLEQVSSLVHKELDAEVMSQGGISMEHLQKSNVCPLCLKSFDRIVPHVKSCAAKKKVGTDKLFEAIKLQLKQHQEREAMGLPPLVQQPAPKKKSKAKATVSVPEGYDSSLELAKALSESAAMESQDSYVCNSEANSSSGSSDTTKKTASIFGPASSNVSSCTSKLKGGSSLLFNRSDEDRERIVTEKVAIVLLHSDEQDNLINESAPVIPSSSKMKENLNKEGILWERAASETTVAADYYVASLAQFVAPSSTARVGRLLRRVSQLPGRPKSPSPPTTPPPSPPPPPLSQSPEML